jgi:hypothetical protein
VLPILCIMTLSRMLTSSNLQVCTFFLAKMWVVIEGKLSRTFEWKQKISKNNWEWLDGPHQLYNWECGFYVMKFMTKYYNYMYWNNAIKIKVQLPLPTPLSFWNNWVQDYLHPKFCNLLLVVGDTNLVFKGSCD